MRLKNIIRRIIIITSGAPLFYKPVAQVFNLSIATSTAPPQWKRASRRGSRNFWWRGMQGLMVSAPSPPPSLFPPIPSLSPSSPSPSPPLRSRPP